MATRESPKGAIGERQDAILQAAIDLFYEAGYAGTSVRDVANAAGIQKGTLYHYVDNKEDLLLRVVERLHEDVERIYAGVARSTHLTPLERLAEAIRQLTLYRLTNGRHYAVVMQDRTGLSDERRATVRQWGRERTRFFETLIQEAVAHGELPAGVDAQLATACFRALPSSICRHGPPVDESPEELAAFTARFVIDAIRGSSVATRAALTVAGSPRPKKRRRRAPHAG